jgi:4'-phosphopantetheinyl transferase EntD
VRIDDLPGLFDDDRVVVLAAEPSDEALAALTTREAEQVARAVAKRKREFATGRVLARRAMERLGVAPVEILNDPERAPIWPAGITGSISHCDTRVVVALGRRFEVGSVGIDVEHRPRLERKLWPMVFLPEEIAALDRDFEDVEQRGRMALVLFAAKEALYKAQYPVSRTFMGWMALQVALEPRSEDAGALACTFRIDVPPLARGSVVRGRYRLDALAPGREVIAAIRIEAGAIRRRPFP